MLSLGKSLSVWNSHWLELLLLVVLHQLAAESLKNIAEIMALIGVYLIIRINLLVYLLGSVIHEIIL